MAPESIDTTIVYDQNYGQRNTIYHTENQSFVKIIALDQTPDNKIKYFKAYTKSGEIIEFGNTEDSRIYLPNTTTPLHWLVNRIEDRNGNYILFQYVKNNLSGNFYPDKILYSGNTNSGLLPYNRVEFNYTSRKDSSTIYIQGKKIVTNTKRLNKITSYSENNIARLYNFEYISNPSYKHNYSLLQKITECSNSGCLNPTQFTWHEPTFTGSRFDRPYPISEEKFKKTNTTQQFFLDFDGDGDIDFLYFNILTGENTIFLDYVQGNKTIIENPIDKLQLKDGYLRVLDLNLDGVNDIMWNNPFNGISKFFIGEKSGNNITFKNPTSIVLPTAGETPFGKNTDVTLKDFDGDGRTDIIYYKRDDNGNIISFPPTIWINKSVTNLNVSVKEFHIKFEKSELEFIAGSFGLDRVVKYDFEDVDNDTKTDIILFDEYGRYIIYQHTITATGETFSDENRSKRIFKVFDSIDALDVSFSWMPKFQARDINGDGQAEKIFPIFQNDTLVKYVIYIDGKEDNILEITHPVFANHKKLRLLDADSDGLVDFCFYNEDSGENYTFLNRGNFRVVYEDSNDPPYYNLYPVDIFKKDNYFVQLGTKTGRLINGYPSNSYLWYNLNTGVGNYVYTEHLHKTGFLLSNIVEGENALYVFDYNTLYSQYYKKTPSLKRFPYTEVVGPLRIVTNFSIFNKNNSLWSYKKGFSYFYEGAMANTLDRGFFGFQKVIKRDIETGIEDIAYYSFDSLGVEYLTNRLVKTEKRFSNNGNLIAQTTLEKGILKYPNYLSTVTGFNYDTRNRSYFDYVKKATHKNYELGQVLDNSNTNSQTIDYFGNVTNAVVNYGDGFKDSTVSVYTNNINDWILGRLTYSKLFRFATGKPTTIRSSAFEYDIKGRLIKEISNPDSSAVHQIIKQYHYDDYGNIIKSDLIAWNGSSLETRTSRTIYDSKGRFMTKSINAFGHETLYQYDNKLGLVTLITDPNGTTITYQYDSFGRKIKDIGADGNWVQTDLRVANQVDFSSPTNAAYVKYIQSSLDPPTIEHYDIFDRLLLKETIGFDGKKILSKVEYDKKGQPFKETRPHYSNETIYWNESKYDTLGRVIKNIAPGNRISTVSYNVGQVTKTNPLGQKVVINSNVRDQITSIVDNNNQQLQFQYDGIGQLLRTIDPKGNATQNQYSFKGERIKASDPNSGEFRYFYNGFGELIKQINSRGQITTIEYDKLGRTTKKTQTEGITTWIYDVGNKSIGKLSTINSPNEITTYIYDNLGRVESEKQIIQGKTYIRSFTYDVNGRLKDINHLSGKLITRQIYNEFNYVSEIRNITGGLNQLLWKLNKTNAIGQIEQQQYGNGLITNQLYDPEKGTINRITTQKTNNQIILDLGYTFDAIGRLTERTHLTKNKREVFSFDNLNRLTKTEVVGSYSVDIAYDNIGNITYKSDVGIYIYGLTNNGPHRLIRVDLLNPSTCIPSFSIDAEYNSFNKASKISNDTSRIDILYDSGQKRIVQNLYLGSLWQRTRTYLANYAQIDSTKNKVETTIYIGSPVGIIGTYVITKTNNTIQTTFAYWHKDHLGSITGVSDSNGTITEYSYDAWGHRRNADWSALTGKPTGYDRGFTGHEHYDLFGLIDMNGRIYDPLLARFLSPDPIIQEQSNLQNYNRYSYVFNNPLSYTDPTGFWGIGDVFDFLDDVFGGVGEIINDGFDGVIDTYEEYFKFHLQYTGINWVIENKELVITLVANYYLPPGVGAFTATMINNLMAGNSFSESLRASAKSGIMSYVSYQLTGIIGDGAGWTGEYFSAGGNAAMGSIASYTVSVLGHGLVQGAMEVADGGKFLHGFGAGAFTVAVSPLYQDWAKESRIFMSAMAGGTASRISGSSFTNGAVAGAFIQMFNHDSHSVKGSIQQDFCGSETTLFSISSDFFGINYSFNTSWIPESFLGVNASLPCKSHDLCVGNKKMSELQCALNFKNDIYNYNKISYPSSFQMTNSLNYITTAVNNSVANFVSYGYSYGVYIGGGKAYEEAQRKSILNLNR